jgi:hypothetical protein
MLPELYKAIYPESSLQADRIDIISCSGLSCKQYPEIAKKTNHKVAVITDNDVKTENLDCMNAYNAENARSHVFMSGDTGADGWTWEANIYSLNKALVCEGVMFLQPPKPMNGTRYNRLYVKDNKLKHYIPRKKYYCSLMAKLILKNGGALLPTVINRANKFYDALFIDEYQDYRNEEYELL